MTLLLTGLGEGHGDKSWRGLVFCGCAAQAGKKKKRMEEWVGKS